ncbi:MAG: RAMP superfamily CRISPR-associated protein [Armatimonadota bacterium]
MNATGANRIYFIGKIKVNAPLHIGLGLQTPGIAPHETDQPILLNSKGEPFIPATSLGGLMRSVGENLVSVLDGWDLRDLLSLFGATRQSQGESKTQESKTEVSPPLSKVRLKNARLVKNWRGWTEVRDSVGIDRKRGAAAEGIKFDYEVAPPGLEFDFWAELRDGNDRDKILMALVLTAMQTLPLAIGAKGASGLGALQLCLDKVVELNLTDKETLLGFLLEQDKFILNSDGKSWDDWRREMLQNQNFTVKANHSYHRIPQVFVFTYQLTVEDPLLVANKRIDPTLAFDGLVTRKNKDLRKRERQEIDTVWMGTGNAMDMSDWTPIIPGPSARGVFRSHCERILRTLSWHHAEECLQKSGKQVDEQTLRTEYELHCAAKVDLWERDELLQSKVDEKWQQIMRGEGTEEEKWHRAGKEIANLVWQNSDISEKMFGSTFWKSLVSVSEVYLKEGAKWQEMIFDHLAVERFSGGAMEGKKFDTLPITQATFEGKISVWGDENFMLGLVALFFKDFCDGLVRFGSGKTRGYGKLSCKLTKVEAFLLHGTNLANKLGIQQEAGKAWHYRCWELPDPKFPECLQNENLTDLKELLCEAVQGLNELVKQFRRQTDKKEGEEG